MRREGQDDTTFCISTSFLSQGLTGENLEYIHISLHNYTFDRHFFRNSIHSLHRMVKQTQTSMNVYSWRV